jgi:hypothetical protein
MDRQPDSDKHFEQYELIICPLILKLFRIKAYYCPKCKRIHFAKLPAEANTGFFGPCLMTFLGYLKGMGHISITDLPKILSVLGLNVSRGVICKNLDKASEALYEAYNEVKEAIPSSQY